MVAECPRHNYHPGLLALAVCVFVVLLLGSTISARYGSPATAGAAGRGTVPPSRYAGTDRAPDVAAAGLVNTPSPLDDTSNLAIPGNVGGGKTVRDNIRYRSATSFGSPLGSADLDPFLRYSALPQESDNSAGGTTSFYSPTGTVARIQPGFVGAFAPGSPRVRAGMAPDETGRPADLTAPLEAPSLQVFNRRPAATGVDAGTWPWMGTPLSSRTQDEMRRLVAGEPDSPVTDRRPLTQSRELMTSEQYQQQLEQLQRDLDRVRSNASQLEQSLKTGRSPTVSPMLSRPMEPVQPLCSPETVRRIVQPDFEWQAPPLPENPPANLDLRGGEGDAGPGPRVPTAPWGPAQPLEAAPTPGTTGAVGPVLVPPQSPLNRAGTGAGTVPRVGSYGQPAPWGTSTPAAPSTATNPPYPPQTPGSGAGQTAPAPAPAPGSASAARTPGAYVEPLVPGWGRNQGAVTPAVPRVPRTYQASDTPAAILERSLRDSQADRRSPAAGGVLAYQPPGGDSVRVPAAQPRVGEAPKVGSHPLPASPAPSRSLLNTQLGTSGLGSQSGMSLSGSASGTIPAGSPSGNPAAAAGQNSARPTPAALAGGASPLAGRSATSGTVPAPAPVERAPSGTVPPAGRSVPTPLEALRAQPANPSAPPAGGRSAAQPANRPPETKFDRYMQAAQLDMQQGQYLPAAESFALASVCSPKDARPQIGRCHALFAAGDFPGSAVCLAKAIELDPRLILKKPEQKSEFVEAAGGPDRFVQRITELEQRVRAGSVPGLQVLLAYFYHAMDRTEQARTAIRIAKRALPAPAAVTLLEAAIEGKPLN